MTSEKGQESPMEKYIRFKNNIELWYQEMDMYGLTKEEQETLKPYFLPSHGVPPSQEQMMKILMDENICGFTLADANAARKIVGKKQMSKIPALKEKVMQQAKSLALGRYVWDCGIGPQMGYSFSIIHALAYSFIGFQTAYLATHWNPIYWNTACLIVNSGSLMEDSDYEEDEDGNLVKKKEKSADYGKIAKALGEILSRNIKISLIDINKSNYTFEPDDVNNEILFGLKALSGIGDSVIEQILANRPYTGIKDFMTRCPLNKTAMISLIKAGAFDKVEEEWGKQLGVEPRIAVMTYYLSQVSEPKKKLNLQNFNGLIQANLIPQEMELQKKSYLFNKFLRGNQRVGDYYIFNEACETFYNQFFDIEQLEVIQGHVCISQLKWDKMYQKVMDAARDWLRDNQEEVLRQYNTYLFKEMWKKYAVGSISTWEMEALCFYYHDHELKNVNKQKYGLVNFFDLASEPIVDTVFKRNGKEIPLFKLFKIAGTVINKNDARSSISLLTTEGVVTVKFTRDYYAMYARQVSERQEDGTKKVIEKGWFNRGTKVLCTGYRRDDMFITKTYAKTPTHQLYKIINIDKEGNLELIHDRAKGKEEDEE